MNSKPEPANLKASGESEPTHPLGDFYVRQGKVLPPMQVVEGVEVPEPYRSLLVHDQDMTSTLEAFHGGEIEVGVLGRNQEDSLYSREVVLRVVETGKPVEFGAIRIHLDQFPEEARRRILEEHWPLGRILKECQIPFVSRPQAYLCLASDPLINDLLHLAGAQVLYGRRNILFHPAGQPMAEIVEILPPEADPPSELNESS